MRLARTPPEPPPIVNRSKSYFRLLEVGEIDLHQLKLRRERLVLGLVGEPLEGVPYAALDLRARYPLDADEHRRQVGEVARLRLAAHRGSPPPGGPRALGRASIAPRSRLVTSFSVLSCSLIARSSLCGAY